VLVGAPGCCDDTHDRLIESPARSTCTSARPDMSASADFRSRLPSHRVVLPARSDFGCGQANRALACAVKLLSALRDGADVLGSAKLGPGSTNGESFCTNGYSRRHHSATADWRLVTRDTFVDVARYAATC